MRELFDIIRANPWPFGAGLFVVILMIIVENFGRCIRGEAPSATSRIPMAAAARETGD
jgi:hypothetical protein